MKTQFFIVLSLAFAYALDDVCNCDLELLIDTSCSVPSEGKKKIARFLKELIGGGFKKIGVVAYDKRQRVVSKPATNDKNLENLLNKLPDKFCEKGEKCWGRSLKVALPFSISNRLGTQAGEKRARRYAKGSA